VATQGSGKRSKTIAQAITNVLAASKRPMTAEEICRAIQSEGLYEFRAADPVSIVRQQIRRRCAGLELAGSSPDKRFRLEAGQRYSLIAQQ
jgi:restriction system protein